MITYQNGYGETVKVWEKGDKALYTSSKYPDLKPYEVTITGIYDEMDHGHPAYLMYTDANGNLSGWELWGSFSEIA